MPQMLWVVEETAMVEHLGTTTLRVCLGSGFVCRGGSRINIARDNIYCTGRI
jgi:hypothetical protein